MSTGQNDFMAALNGQNKNTPEQAIRIELVINKNQIRVFPSNFFQHDKLEHLGAHYDPKKYCFVFSDNQEIRDWLNSEFNAGIEPLPALPLDEDVLTPKPAQPKASFTLEVRDTPPPTPEFAEYQRRVKELCACMECTPADLCITAVNYYYDMSILKL